MYILKKKQKTALANFTSYDRCKTIRSYLKQKPKGMGKNNCILNAMSSLLFHTKY